MILKQSKNGIRYLTPGTRVVNFKEIAEVIRESEVVFSEPPTPLLFKILESLESRGEKVRVNYLKNGSTNLARRIILAGGFLKYIRELEK